MALPRVSRLTLITGALLVLLPALALLQYRWVGQVSEAERERMQRTLRAATTQFRESFDGEVARAFVSLQVDNATAREEAWGRYAERHAGWAGTTPFPQLVAQVLLVGARDGQMRLRRWNTQARSFEDASWDGALAAARPRFEQALRAFAQATPEERLEFPAIDGDDSLLVAPLPDFHLRLRGGPPPTPETPLFGFTIVQLNLPFIREQLLPSLAQRHFGTPGGEGYHLAVIDASNPARAIYRSSADAPNDPTAADVAEPLFGLHHDPLLFLARGAVVPSAVDARRNVVVSVLRRAGEQDVIRARVHDRPAGRWHLLAQHRSGSLEAAVGLARRRNLLVSFGVLLLLGVSIGMLAVSSRRAQQLARQQMEFVAGVSHELRTPVAVIRSAAENLSHGVVGDADRVRRYGSAIEVEARRLTEMVERVLQFAGLSSGRTMPRAPVAVAALVQDALEASAPLLEQHGARVDVHVSPDVPLIQADAASLRSAIQNLVANAVKYGGPDRWVGVGAERAGAGPRAELRLTVEDHGAGIAPEDLPHLGEPFYRGAYAIARQIPGSGLGLSLVKRIAEAHGGRLTISSHPGQGSAFTIRLPITGDAETGDAPVHVPAPSPRI